MQLSKFPIFSCPATDFCTAPPLSLPSATGAPSIKTRFPPQNCSIALQCNATGLWSRHYAPRTASKPSMAHTTGCCAIIQDIVNLLSPDISWCGFKTWYVSTNFVRYLIRYCPQCSVERRVGKFSRWEPSFTIFLKVWVTNWLTDQLTRDRW